MELLKSELDHHIIKVQIGAILDQHSQALSGSVELDIENQARFVDLINVLIMDDGVSKIIIDLSNVTYVDSSGLWALFEGHKKVAQKNGKLVLLNPTKDVRRVLDITKISSKVSIADTEQDAIGVLLSQS